MGNLLKNYTLNGELLPIIKYPDQILKKVANPITEFTDTLETLVKNMLFTMYKAPGLGLAAPQIGKSLQLFVIDIDYEREKITNPDDSTDFLLSNFNPQIFINPKLSNFQGEILHEEGCLSVPGIYEEVKRANNIIIEHQDIKGNKHSLEAEELLAICLQHENDHLNGVIFLERLSLLKKKILKKKYLKERKKEELN